MKKNSGFPTIPIGDPLVQLVVAAYQANQPVLLFGGHGIGKSELLQQCSVTLGAECRVFDLSIMEPPDLLGIPYRTPENRTAYAPPEDLPTKEKGILLFEELNRAPSYMRAPCLQLLTARRLNSYQLPDGWVPMAAINNAEDGYDVDELDPALLSRFLQIHVVPDVKHWTAWAKSAGVHERVIEYVSTTPKIFSAPDSNPRSWTYVSNVTKTSENAGLRVEELLALISGLVGETSAVSFLQFYRGGVNIPSAAEIVKNYPAHRGELQAWVQKGELDLVEVSLEKVFSFLGRKRSRGLNETMRQNLVNLAADLPGDLERKFRVWLAQHGFRGILRGPKP